MRLSAAVAAYIRQTSHREELDILIAKTEILKNITNNFRDCLDDLLYVESCSIFLIAIGTTARPIATEVLVPTASPAARLASHASPK